jgi:hypothetical protein
LAKIVSNSIDTFERCLANIEKYMNWCYKIATKSVSAGNSTGRKMQIKRSHFQEVDKTKEAKIRIFIA